MPVLNDSEKLYLGSILVDKVMYGESQIWPPLPVLESITPSTSVEPPTTCVVEIYGSNFIVGSDVCWVNSKTPNNAPFASAATYRDSTHLTTTLHHLAANNDFLVWVRSNRNNEVSNRVNFPVTPPIPDPLVLERIDPVIGFPESQVLDLYGTGFLPQWTGSTDYSVVSAYAFGDMFQIGDSMIFIDSTHIQVPDFWPDEGDYQIVVMNHAASGQVIEESNTVLYTCIVNDPHVPILESIDPNVGSGGAVDLHLYGTNFEYTVNPVVFFRHSSGNNHTAYALYIDDTHIHCPGFVSTISTEIWTRNPAPSLRRIKQVALYRNFDERLI